MSKIYKGVFLDNNMKRKNNNINILCFYCKKEFDTFRFQCHHCGGYFCGNCRLPEDHKCIKWDRGNLHKEDYFKTLVQELKTNKKTLTLEEKKELFIRYAKQACDYFKVSTPLINFETIEHFSEDEDGHFHPDLCMICVD